jgi:hypothetical protein
VISVTTQKALDKKVRWSPEPSRSGRDEKKSLLLQEMTGLNAGDKKNVFGPARNRPPVVQGVAYLEQ